MPSRFTIAGPAGTVSLVDTEPVDDAGIPALFLHGINGGAVHWLPLIERLSADRRCIAPDLRGHGESDKVGPFTADDYLADALAVLDHLGIARAHVVGTSFGGCVAVRMAGKAAERVASLIALGSTLKPAGIDVDEAVAGLRAVGARSFFAQFLPAASFRPGTDEAIIDDSLEVACNGRDEDLIEAVSRAAFGADLTAAAGDVSAPGLVLSGAFDLTCPVSQGSEMARQIGAELRTLPDRGHMAMLEDPDQVAAEIRPFLAQHDAGE